MPINVEIAEGILRFFHEKGSEGRKRCICGKGPATTQHSRNVTTRKLSLPAGNGDAGAGGHLPDPAPVYCTRRSIYGRTGVDDDVDGWFNPRLMIIFTSTRRF